MLFNQAVSSSTFNLLRSVAGNKQLSDFRLAGGTALALQTGHRISYDLDFFCFCQTENESVLEALSDLRPFTILSQSKNLLTLNIGNIKVDFVKYGYDFLDLPQLFDGISMASTKDIAAMKIAAITGRGRRRDFVDLFFLLRIYSMKDMLGFYKRKYADGNELMALRSLVYFEDAELDPEVVFLNEKPEWKTIKSTILDTVRQLAG